jgi:hypothetical protein
MWRRATSSNLGQRTVSRVQLSGARVSGKASLNSQHGQSKATDSVQHVTPADSVQKAAKTLATNNTSTLNRTHIITASLQALFHLLRYTSLSSGNRTFLLYLLLTVPALALEIFLKMSSRPQYTTDSAGVLTLRTSSGDLEATGLTEYF